MRWGTEPLQTPSLGQSFTLTEVGFADKGWALQDRQARSREIGRHRTRGAPCHPEIELYASSAVVPCMTRGDEIPNEPGESI